MHTATLVHLCQGIRQLFVISDQRASHTLIDLRVQAVDQTAPRHQRAVDQNVLQLVTWENRASSSSHGN